MGAVLLICTASANAGIIVTSDHISTGSAVGTLMAVDVPYFATLPGTGGPDWAEDADDGFLVVNHAVQETWTNGQWEPDGTPQAENRAYQVYPNAAPNVTYTFDIPDGSTINAIYATWAKRSNLFGRYHYSEGAALDSLDVVQTGHPLTDLGLDWTDDVNAVRTAPFQLLFNASHKNFAHLILSKKSNSRTTTIL